MKLPLLLSLVLGITSSLSFAAPKEPADSKKSSAKEEKKVSPEKKPSQPRADDEILADAKKLTDTLTAAQKTKLLELLNKGDVKGLRQINGIGEKRAQGIIAKRPYAKVDDLALVDDIGEKTFANVVAYGKGEQPVTEKKPAPKAGEPKKKGM